MLLLSLITICSKGGAAVMSAPVVATGRFCWPWPGAMGGAGATWVTAVGASARCEWAHVESETVRSCHPLSASLSAYSQWWREGVVWAGTVDGIETASFHDHRYAGIVISIFARVR